MPRKSWFDEERHGELTNSTSLSNTSAQQQQIDRHYWEESRQINDVIVAPTRQTTYSRFQQIDEPMELQPNANHFMNSSNSSAKTQIVSFLYFNSHNVKTKKGERKNCKETHDSIQF